MQVSLRKREKRSKGGGSLGKENRGGGKKLGGGGARIPDVMIKKKVSGWRGYLLWHLRDKKRPGGKIQEGGVRRKKKLVELKPLHKKKKEI